MTTRPHLQWLQHGAESTIRYRFFYAQEDDIGVEVVVNRDYQLQVGVLKAKNREYHCTHGCKLLQYAPLYSSQAMYYKHLRFDKPLEESLLEAASNIPLIPFAKKAVEENIETILQNIKDFLEPYHLASKIFLSDRESLPEAFPEHQLYAMIHTTSKQRGISFNKAYLVKSEKGLPYTIQQSEYGSAFQTAFVTDVLLWVSLKEDSHMVSAVATPYVLKPKTLHEFQPNTNRTIRVSFAKINDFNPCLIREEIIDLLEQDGLHSIYLDIAPYPTLAFHQYLKGEVELPKETTNWILR